MNEKIIKLVNLGKIPDDKDMSNEMFNKYDELIQIDEPLTYEEAESIISLFSDDCYDLNWGLLHLIETVDIQNNEELYRSLISRCNNDEFREMFEMRLNNALENT